MIVRRWTTSYQGLVKLCERIFLEQGVGPVEFPRNPTGSDPFRMFRRRQNLLLVITGVLVSKLHERRDETVNDAEIVVFQGNARFALLQRKFESSQDRVPLGFRQGRSVLYHKDSLLKVIQDRWLQDRGDPRLLRRDVIESARLNDGIIRRCAVGVLSNNSSIGTHHERVVVVVVVVVIVMAVVRILRGATPERMKRHLRFYAETGLDQ